MRRIATAAAGCFDRGSGAGAKAGASPAPDPYDVAKMDLKPVPAVLSNDRHTGAFAQGSALSMDALLKVLR